MIISRVCFSSVEQVVVAKDSSGSFFLIIFITRKSLSFPAVACKSCPSRLQATCGICICVYILLVVFCQANNFFSNIVNYILKKEHYNACVLIPTASV